ncbi:hypothetical protein MTO96_023804 [Rhipicephalus appendiculatus]
MNEPPPFARRCLRMLPEDTDAGSRVLKKGEGGAVSCRRHGVADDGGTHHEKGFARAAALLARCGARLAIGVPARDI